HPALLPSFPGAHGVRDALAHGVKVTGASVIEVDAGVDTGRILAQVAVDVRDDDTEDTLHQRIKDAEQPLLVDVVRRLSSASCPCLDPRAARVGAHDWRGWHTTGECRLWASIAWVAAVGKRCVSHLILIALNRDELVKCLSPHAYSLI